MGAGLRPCGKIVNHTREIYFVDPDYRLTHLLSAKGGGLSVLKCASQLFGAVYGSGNHRKKLREALAEDVK